MIPVAILIILTLVLVGLLAYYFLVGNRGYVPYSELLCCVIGVFGSVFCAINVASGNVGESVANAVTNGDSSSVVLTDIVMVDAGVSWLYIGAAILFVGLIIYSLVGVITEHQENKYA